MALENPDGLALEDGENQWTYEELDGLVEGGASQLLKLGVRPGINVLLVSEVNVTAVVMVHSVFRTGSTLVPVNPRSGLQEGLLDKSTPQIVLVSKQLERTSNSFLKNYEDRSELLIGSESLGIWASEGLNRNGSDRMDRSVNFPAAILLTSGTEGRPKMVPIMHEALEHSADAIKSRLSLSSQDRWYASLSVGHIGGLALVHRVAWIGSTLLVRAAFSVERLIEVVESQSASHISVVPTMLRQLLQGRGDKQSPTTLKALVVGGASIDASLLNRALSLGYPIVLTYGMTETCSQVTTTPVGLVKQKPGTVGAPIDGLEIKIGEDREIWVRGPTVLDDSTDEEGWFATGDLGEIDEVGHLWINGRRRDIIITGGVNVDPVRVANEIRSLPGVLDVAVVGLLDEVWGETVGALVVPESQQSMGASAILEILEDRLSTSQLPRKLDFVTEIPTNQNGKIDRHAVRSILCRDS